MKKLQFTIKKKWFDMLGNGKPEEYRELTAFWSARLLYRIELPSEIGGFLSPLRDLAEGNFDFKNWKEATGNAPVFQSWDQVLFANGGHFGNVPKKTFDFKGIEIREGNPEWGAEPGKKYFVIKLGKQL